MAAFVLDASAALAVLLDERGSDAVIEAMEADAAMSAVNVSEVAAALYQRGWREADVAQAIRALSVEVLPFDLDAALLCGSYRPATRDLGLGLADRACLAAARVAGCPALTGDHVWQRLDLPGVTVQPIR